MDTENVSSAYQERQEKKTASLEWRLGISTSRRRLIYPNSLSTVSSSPKMIMACFLGYPDLRSFTTDLKGFPKL